jgi:hypothetical protein
MGNSQAGSNGKESRFTRDKQPPKRGRLKSIFGPLAKENNLSLDDVRKIYKNILTAKGTDNLNDIKEKYPSMLTNMTIDMLKQDMLGKLTGRKVMVKVNGEFKEIDERIKSYETIQYMLDRIYGIPAKVDLNVSGGLQLMRITEDDEEALE